MVLVSPQNLLGIFLHLEYYGNRVCQLGLRLFKKVPYSPAEL